MKLTIAAFGIAKDIIGGPEIQLLVPEGITVMELKTALQEEFPQFGSLASLAIAVNNEYGDQDQILKLSDEIVLIPPVSGG